MFLVNPFFVLKSIQTIEDEERRMRSSTDNTVDVVLKTNIEGIIVKWGVQVVKFMRVNNASCIQILKG